jgi:hypothetical protein
MAAVNDLYGWYERADQASDAPTYDPPHDAPCPYCGNALIAGDVRAHSMMAVERPTRSYFYRTHRTCDDTASDGQKQSVFDGVLYRVAHDGEPVV